MRRRKKKGADEKLLSYEEYVFHNPSDIKGKWKEKFNKDKPIYLEVGTGRGKFVTTLSKENEDINYIGMEIKEEVLLRAVEKADEAQLDNILFIWGDVNNLSDYFEEGELDRIYINFCDPWPKNRWAKRRLTFRKFLETYKSLLAPKGEVHFKTDNEKLFEFSLNEFSYCDLKLKNITFDLANSDFLGNVTTEYEEKFMDKGLKIFRCEGIKRD